ncbi:hypothetical protein D7V77_04835 [Corallococcus sp. CA041A]|uniref:hypothetical protein n=1 Tax=Corallococcus sp. CA041A TaxID=2316727 RepID=UPI000EA0822F|nr:hypothetical protein [Corallococcus sp. CA041A]RKH29760.1 hypothetical protein D7V77_04835 [Corallococcus sp. CA041A]
MDDTQPPKSNPTPRVRPTLVRLSIELAEAFEDYRHEKQKQQRRHVTKRELVEQALWQLITPSEGNP